MKYLIVIILLTAFSITQINCSFELKLKYEFLNVAFGSHVLQRVFATQNETIQNCSLNYIYNNTEVGIPLDIKTSSIAKDDYFGTRIKSLGRNICGFVLETIQEADPFNYSFIINYTNLTNELNTTRKQFYIEILELNELPNDSIETSLGSYFRISCGLYANVRVSCLLYRPNGELLQSGCVYDVSHVTLDDIGRWKCVSSIKGNIETYQHYVEVSLKDKEKMDTWYTEEDGYGLIGCKYYKTYDELVVEQTPTYCQFIRPDGEILTLSDAGANGRYTSVGSYLNNYICQIEFKLPLQSNEIGRWQCKIESTGGFINVHSTTTDNFPSYILHKVNLGNPLTIDCNVSHTIENCYIQSPTGVIYSGGNYLNYWKGDCSINIAQIDETHLGIWECHLAHPTKAEDDVINVEVETFDAFKFTSKELTGEENQSIELMCKSPVPILYCRFQAPNGQTYHVSPYKQSQGMQYIGKGFDYGDCGMIIENLKRENHEGDWKCFVRSASAINDDFEMMARATILVVNDSSKLGLSIGLPIALVAIFAIAGIAFIWYRRRRGNIQENDNYDESELPIISNSVRNSTNYTHSYMM